MGQKLYEVIFDSLYMNHQVLKPPTVKPSISIHSKPHTMACERLLKCFVLQHSVLKTRHLSRLAQGIVQGFE